MANYIQDFVDRIEAMCKEAVTTLKTDIDVHEWPYQQETLPYFTLRVGPRTTDVSSFDEFIQANVHTVLLRLVTGHITEGVIDQVQDTTSQYIGLVEGYFEKHPMLSTDAGTFADDGGPDYLLIGQGIYQAPITGHTGHVIFANSGIGAQQIGCEFTLRLPYLRDALP